MADILLIDTATVTVDGEDIDFDGVSPAPPPPPPPPPVDPIDSAQFSVVSIMAPETIPDVAEFAALSVMEMPPVPARVASFACVEVIRGNRRLVTLRNVVGLNCWSSCTAYGTNALVVILDRRK